MARNTTTPKHNPGSRRPVIVRTRTLVAVVVWHNGRPFCRITTR